VTLKELSSQKHLFSLPAGIHYLNCAYMSPLSKQVEAAGITGIKRKCNPTNIQPKDFFTDSDRVRSLFANLINAKDPQRIAILPSVSYGMAIVAQNLTVTPGQNIVIADEQFPSNVYAWSRLQEKGAILRKITPPQSLVNRSQNWNNSIIEAIDRNTLLVALPHVHWTDGTKFDLVEISRKVKEVGAALVIDGTQSVGALPFDLDLIRPDALICGAYKWLLGPYSISLGYFNSRFDGGQPLEETWLGRLGSEDFSNLVNYQSEYQPKAIRYDVGQRSNQILLPMLIAALEHLLEWQPENIQEYCDRLIEPISTEAVDRGYWIEAKQWRSSHLFGLRIDRDRDIKDLQIALKDRNVFVSVRGNAIRVSPHLYNDRADISGLLAALSA